MKMGKEVEELKRVFLGTRNPVTGEYSFPILSYYKKEKIFDAAIRAVREDCAEKCEQRAVFYRSLREKGPGGMIDTDTARAIAADDCAAAIRSRKGRGK